jgi:hypothetical protein
MTIKVGDRVRRIPDTGCHWLWERSELAKKPFVTVVKVTPLGLIFSEGGQEWIKQCFTKLPPPVKPLSEYL